MDLRRLAVPFPLGDIEWRVSRSGMNRKGEVFSLVLAYITARAIQQRLDEVCGPENWQNAERIMEVSGKPAFACGISIKIESEWVTKWDVSGATNVEPIKGGFSGAMKRAGAQWGIGRYLYYLDETFAEISETNINRNWRYAKLSDKHGGAVYYWKPPGLPAWALPKGPDSEVSKQDLADMANAWREKFGAGADSPDQRGAFARFVNSVVGDFPFADHTCWTQEALVKCQERIESTTDPNGIAADVPFGSES